MNFFRRYWAAALVLVIVVLHAAFIGYVRTHVAKLTRADGDTVEVGVLRFQHTSDPATVYQFRLHVILDPVRRLEAERVLRSKRVEVQEASEHLLRQVNAQWLSDPLQMQLRERLLEIIVQQLTEPLVTRVLITEWLELPTGVVARGSLAATP